MDQGVDGTSAQLRLAVQEVEFDDEREADDDPAEAFDEGGDGGGGAAGGEHVIDDQNALPGGDGIAMDFEGVGAVFEGVLDGLDGSGQFLWLPNGDEAFAERLGDGGGEEEATGFDADDDVNVGGLDGGDEAVDDFGKAWAILHQGGDVVEENAGFGPVRDFADELLEVDHLGVAYGVQKPIVATGVADGLRGAQLSEDNWVLWSRCPYAPFGFYCSCALRQELLFPNALALP